MADEEKKPEKKPEQKPDEEQKKDEEKKVSIVDEARGIRDEIIKARDELKAENDRKDKLQANEMLSGSAGGHIEATLPKEESPKEYRDRIDKEISEGKHAE